MMPNKVFVLSILTAVLSTLLPFVAYAQSGAPLSLSVSPTLFEMSAVPSQVWKSGIKIINNNKHELVVYASVVNFAPQGELGEGKFLPVFENFTEGATLAEWIDISSEPIVIKAEQSKQVPFTVAVPSDASPGGHFAAIMIGTRPPETEGVVQVKTSQIVTSLFFVRVAGDVIEDGAIREFVVEKTFADTPEATFQLRFENNGNVHIQPQGEIVITNMWGKERGVIPINHKTHFGNVLPESIRKFEFTWKGEQTFADIGRYKAVASLGYGVEKKQFDSSITYFWVIPVKPALIFLVSFFGGLWFISWCIRAYVRRMLALAGVDPRANAKGSASFVREGDVRIVRRSSIKAPVQTGVYDLKQHLKLIQKLTDVPKVLMHFVVKYKVFFLSVCALCLLGVMITYFITSVFTETRDYEVIIDNPDVDVTISSEEILYEQQQTAPKETSKETFNQTYDLILINSSDTPGAAGALQTMLQDTHYITRLESDFEKTKDRTVIVYSTNVQDEALALSKMLGNALLSAAPETASSTESSIRIYIGNDFEVKE